MEKSNKDYKFVELQPTDVVNPLNLYNNTPLTQASFYGQWQKSIGKEVRSFAIYDNTEQAVLYMQLVRCSFPFGKSYYTCSYGPVFKQEHFNEELLEFLKLNLQNVFKEDESLIFTRMDFSPTLSKEQNKTANYIFTKSHWTNVHGAHFQPRREWALPLQQSEKEILANMHQKTRYNIRLSTRKGVQTEIVTENLNKYTEDFYNAQALTAQRNGFGLHERKYYEAVLQSCDTNKNAYLVIARLNDKIITINLCIVYGNVAMFIFGGSSNEHRNLMPSYLAQWEGIKHAKKLGLEYYNFGGYFDADGPRVKKKTLQKRSQYSVFKRKFGGFALEHSNFYDMVHNRLWYRIYTIYKFFKHV